MPGLNHRSQFKLYANGLGTNWSVLELFETLKEKKSHFFKERKSPGMGVYMGQEEWKQMHSCGVKLPNLIMHDC